MEVVELVVGRLEGVAGAGVPVGEAVGGGAPELGGHGAHALDHPARRGGELGGQAGAGPLGDVLGEVAGALELGHDADDGEGVAEVAGHGRLEEQEPLDVALDLGHQLVDRDLAPADGGEGLGVVAEQGLVGGRHRLGHEREQPDHLLVDGVEVAVEADPQLLRLVGHRRHAELVGGPALEALVVDLAVRGPPDRVDRQHPLGRLVGRQLVLHVDDDVALVEGGAGHELDDGGDGLAELVVGDAHRDGVGDGVVGLQDLLDLLRVHLLAAGVDAHRAAARGA